MRLVHCTLFSLVCLTAACAGPDHAGVDDGEDDSFLQDGKADAFGIAEGSYEAFAILGVHSTMNAGQLTSEVGIGTSAARAVVARRAELGGRFTSLAQLDSARYTGRVFFTTSLTYVRDAGLVGRCGDGVVQPGLEMCDGSVGCDATCQQVDDDGLVHGVANGSYQGLAIVFAASRGVRADFESVGIPTAVAKTIEYDYPDGATLEALAALPGVDGSTFAALFELARQRGWVHRCGDGSLEPIEETCDDANTVDGDGCSAGCDAEWVCGDGRADFLTYEQCDDANQVAGDGCSPTCQWERVGWHAGRELPPNRFGYDTYLGSSGVLLDAWRYTVTTTTRVGIDVGADYWLPSWEGWTEWMLRFRRAHIGGFASQFGPGRGNKLHLEVDGQQFNHLDPAANVRPNLPAGPDSRWDAVVDLAPGTHTITVHVQSCPGCGLGYSLEVVPLVPQVMACGDGARASDEACDDGNPFAGDGCSSTCTLETWAEVEPNDTSASANQAVGFRQLRGSIARGDQDHFRLVLPEAMVVEVSDGAGGCAFDSVVTATGASGTLTDDDGGRDGCSRLSLTAGDHDLAIRQYSSTPAGGPYLITLTPG
jgi:cysteine-rich repeat protein